ncbi:MAG TPA: hypothetical protein VLA89_09960 [Gemmatimonadales bacterium]|nr:hypothetical protein [Gemmatimonadales bacterium]
MSRLDRVNGIHADALRRANGDREVALSILAHRVDDLRQGLLEIAEQDYRGNRTRESEKAYRILKEDA